MRIGKHQEARAARMREAFREVCPEREAKRAAEIAALPVVVWKGQRLRTLRCTGTTGRGPHDQNVPEDLLWHLIDMRTYRCPYHR